MTLVELPLEKVNEQLKFIIRNQHDEIIIPDYLGLPQNITELQYPLSELPKSTRVFGKVYNSGKIHKLIVCLRMGDKNFTQNFHFFFIKINPEYEGCGEIMFTGKVTVDGLVSYTGGNSYGDIDKPEDNFKIVNLIIRAMHIRRGW